MVMNVVILLLVGLGAMLWASRGFFSALLHMMCTLTAGAIAFGLWDTSTGLILDSLDAQWIADSARGMALAGNFAVALIVLTSVTNLIVRANVACTPTVNFVGGMVCGAVIGIVSGGMLTISMSFMRLSQGGSLQIQPVVISDTGSPTRQTGLWVPADTLTAMFYNFVSERSMRTSTPMAHWYPDIADRGWLMRLGPLGPEETATFKVVRPGAFTLVGRYTVAGQSKDFIGGLGMPKETAAILREVKDVSGENILEGKNRIEGFVVRANATAREEKAAFVMMMGNSAVLVAYNPETEETVVRSPVFLLCQGEQIIETQPPPTEEGGPLPQKTIERKPGGIRRVAFSGPRELFGSVGAGDPPPHAFEFIVPEGFEPQALYVRGLRFDVRETKVDAKFASTGEYAGALSALEQGAPQPVSGSDPSSKLRSLFGGGGSAAAGPIDTSLATRIATDPENRFGGQTGVIRADRRLGFMILKDVAGGLSLDENNKILTGQQSFLPTEIGGGGAGGDVRKLRVDEFLVNPEGAIGLRVMVKVDLKYGSPAFIWDDQRRGLLTNPPVLVAADGVAYPCIGYIQKGPTGNMTVRYTPSQVVTDLRSAGVSDLPNRPSDEEVTLLFLVNDGSQVKYFAMGNMAVVELAPPQRMSNN